MLVKVFLPALSTVHVFLIMLSKTKTGHFKIWSSKGCLWVSHCQILAGCYLRWLADSYRRYAASKLDQGTQRWRDYASWKGVRSWCSKHVWSGPCVQDARSLFDVYFQCFVSGWLEACFFKWTRCWSRAQNPLLWNVHMDKTELSRIRVAYGFLMKKNL